VYPDQGISCKTADQFLALQTKGKLPRKNEFGVIKSDLFGTYRRSKLLSKGNFIQPWVDCKHLPRMDVIFDVQRIFVNFRDIFPTKS
jgi:hypothetical protein